MTKGINLISPAEIALEIEELSYDLVRIEDITREDHEYNIAVAGTGQTGLAYNNVSCLSERCELIKKVQSKIPSLIQLLEKYT